MKSLRMSLSAVLILAAALSMAQTWAADYDAGIKAVRSLKWQDARQAFLQALANRPEDVASPTVKPGGSSQWRGGAPYSPNFLAAYAEYRYATTVKDREAQAPMFKTVAEELQTVVDKGQVCPQTLYYLVASYREAGEPEKAQALTAKYPPGSKFAWKVDAELIDPQDVALIEALVAKPQPKAAAAAQPIVQPVLVEPQKPAKPGDPKVDLISMQPVPLGGAVAGAPGKYALFIGNSEGRIQEEMLPFASDDAQRIRDALVTNAGYVDGNIDLVLNATGGQIMASAKALADRIADGSTVLLFFSGVGANLEGKDYLGGVDAQNINGGTGFVAKNDIYRLLMAKGAKIFAFYQVNRSMRDGRYFGMEVPQVGCIAQTQSTMPGARVSSLVRAGKTVGIFAEAFASVVADFHSSSIPINEFGWQIFYRIRRGDTGTTGGGSGQTPTLPVLTNMASDARF